MDFKRVLLIFGLLVNIFYVGAQTQEELIQMARSAGASQAQIQQLLNQGQSQGNIQMNQGSNGSLGGVRTLADSIDMVESQRDRNRILPKEDEVKIYGRDIFSGKSLTFTPDLNIPTPREYILSAGDEVKINIWGNSEYALTQIITPEGYIYIPDLGPVQLSGLSVADAEGRVKSELSKISKGLEDGTNSLSLSLGKIRSIMVNVVGEALVPGTYTLPAFATILNAMYAAGGVNDIGSLRSINLYRNNKLVAELDVYDYLLQGQSDRNVRLESGDVIIISPYDSFVTTKGELKRNYTYELKEGETLEDLLSMAGGFKSSAYKRSVMIDRLAESEHEIKVVNAPNFATEVMFDGDTVVVKSIVMRYNNRLEVTGAVWYPGVYELSEELNSVRELVEAASGLQGDEFAGRAQIIRTNPDFTERVIAVDIRGIVNGTSPDVELQKDDVLNIPLLSDMREPYTIKVAGAVNMATDSLKYRDNMTVEDVIILAGGLMETAATVNVDISRRVKSPEATGMPSKIVEVFTVDLVDGLALTQDGDPVILQPFDEVYVRYSPGYRSQEVVTVNGEVMFRGNYVMKSVNSRISDVIIDAGGVTSEAYVRGASLVRRMNEDEMTRIKATLDLASNNEGKDSLSVASLDITTYNVGIELEKALLNPGGQDDIVLRDGDMIFIPKMQSTVKISGSVVYPNSVTYLKKLRAKDYISLAGGYSDYARKRRPIVIYMNGNVATTKKSCIFFNRYPRIEPGCEVLVTAKRQRDRSSMAEVMSLASSATSMAALISTMVK